MGLSRYQKKRHFEKTPEPQVGGPWLNLTGHRPHSKKGPLRFVVQKHAASRLHYDLRLELGGVLKSWAVPKGPSLDTREKRLAVMVEDHPFDYRTFEGEIPAGNYGAGSVIVWDEGYYWPQVKAGRATNEKILADELRRGMVKITLKGHKLNGGFALVKMHTEDTNAWLFIKEKDKFATTRDIRVKNRSVRSRRRIEDVARKNIPLDLGGAKKSAMPKKVAPMLATLTDEPFDKKGWIFEIKWDGYRAIAETGKSVHLYSRNGISFDDAYPSIVKELQSVGKSAVLDGEIVVVDSDGKPNFQLLQDYRKRPSGQLMYYVFDVLYADGHDVRSLPLLKRKEILKKLLPELSHVKVSDHVSTNGAAFFNEVRRLGLEGIVAKAADGMYETGRRSGSWIKIKTHLRQEVVIGGFTAPRGSRKDLGALICGVYEGDKLTYVGHAGGGFTERTLKDVRKKLQPFINDTSPFAEVPPTNAPATWVKPHLVAEVEFSSWTTDGIMRHPVFLGLRDDKPAREVVREKEVPLKALVAPTKEKTAGEIVIGGKKVPFSHPDKVYWPDEGYTKKNVMEYYRSVSPVILPYLKDRPLSLLRQPHGIIGESFFQKDFAGVHLPAWIKTATMHSESRHKNIKFLLCQNEAALAYLANLGCIEINPWNSRVGSIEYPDYMVIDLDPEDIGFEAVVEVAHAVRAVLEDTNIVCFPKTSGKTGLHIYVPLAAKYDYDQVLQFANIVAMLVNQRLPNITSIQRSPQKRQRRVYVDYLQNRRGQTLAAPYSLRPVVGAPVATPLEWKEVTKRLHPNQFTIKTTAARLEKKGDLFAPVLGKGASIEKALRIFSEKISE